MIGFIILTDKTFSPGLKAKKTWRAVGEITVITF
jgi:hypothetical protein